YFINNYQRNPYMNANGHLDFRNNVIYNGGDRIIRLFSDNTDEQTVNLAYNLILEGPESRYDHEISVRRTSQTRVYNGRIFLHGNRTSRSPEATGDNWQMVADEESGLAFEEEIRSDTPFGAPQTSTRKTNTLLELLDEVGATLPARDQTDQRLAEEVRRGEGGHINHPGQVFGWSAQEPTQRPVEELFSEWAKVTGVDLSDPTQQIRRTEDGYSELERFLHELANRVNLSEGGGAAGAMTFMGGSESLSGTTTEPGIQNSYPNPFREQTRVRIHVPEAETYRLEVFNTAGRRVQILAHRWLPEGEYDMLWNPGHIASGVYLIRLSSPNHQWIRKVVRVR
ncbi:MAG: T9SS type A sorting domain-containing protein, partial [Balneolaceae bacterium]